MKSKLYNMISPLPSAPGALVFSSAVNTSFGFMLWVFIVSTSAGGYGDWSRDTIAGYIINSFFNITNVFIHAWAFSVTYNYIYAQQEALLRAGGRTRTLKNFVAKFIYLSKQLDIYLTETIISKTKEEREHKERRKSNVIPARSRLRTSQELEVEREK